MPAPNLELARLLKTLRERAGLTVTVLAGRSGLAESAIYKAESGARTVRWSTLETGYAGLCLGEDELAGLLALWALGQCRRPPGHALLRATMAREPHAEMPEDQQQVLDAFLQSYRTSAATRRMAAAWLAARKER